MEKGKIIFLNGTSSSGKSSLAIKIQEVSAEKFYHVQLDTFCDMLHEKYFDNDSANTENLVAAIMHNFVLALCKNGENVIVDTVIENHHENWLKECVELLYDMPVTFVKVNCPLHELERRELERGDRNIGQAKGQLSNMNFNDIYDLEVNTYENSTEECVRIIKNEMKLENEQNAFIKIYEKYRKHS
ncbi:chloramphenicol phosphotransferase CPT family protein [Clostridium estertheticum]|uniref:chloramphenicol phosphotransferase CPT family protein n=1 Tax=Clostridium estertheticum TaxID=238834 RepID=UPI0013E95291|nr:AAA family ATPase [Clostridium estertheticum]MBZ9687460.1 chloramphenicol phosphotransferase CPT family protein [Clostridium estertheticum]